MKQFINPYSSSKEGKNKNSKIFGGLKKTAKGVETQITIIMELSLPPSLSHSSVKLIFTLIFLSLLLGD